MGITNRSKPTDIHADMLRRFEIIQNVIVQKLSRLGEEAVNMSRDSLNINPDAFPVIINGKTGLPLRQRKTGNGSDPVFGDYQDQTGNLRASIGYLVAYNGKVKANKFSNSSSRSLAESIVNRFKKGFVLIVVAGEDYALAVESKGYNVISSSEHMVIDKMGPLIKEIQRVIKSMK